MSSLEGDRFLDPAELAALFGALEDESAEVRIAAFEALTRLPLAPSDWREVASFTTRVQISGDSDAERIAVRDASPWVLAKDHPPAAAEWMGGAEPPGFIDFSPGERAEVEAALAMRDEKVSGSFSTRTLVPNKPASRRLRSLFSSKRCSGAAAST